MQEINIFLQSTVIEYLSSLDWLYIITLIIIVEYINTKWNKDMPIIIKEHFIYITPSWRVAFIGTLLALVYFIFNYDQGLLYVKTLFESMVASLAIYAWFMKYIIKGLKKIVEF